MPVSDLHREVAGVALRAAARYGFALGGGNALIAHGVIDRPTEDIDLFTDRENGVAAAADAVEAALRQAGYTAERQDKTAGLADVFYLGRIPFMVAGPFLVVAYNAELFGGIVHTDAGFAAAWGAFPLLTAYVAETGTLSAGSVLAAAAAFGLSSAQPVNARPAAAPTGRLRHRRDHAGGWRHPHHRCAALAPPARAGFAGHVLERRAAGGRPGYCPAWVKRLPAIICNTQHLSGMASLGLSC